MTANNEAAILAGKNQDLESAVKKRYAEGAKEREAELCCPVDYNPEYLKIIPQEILDKDYGCGDPSRYLRKGDVVLDLGSGGGKICYIASQIVGPEGKVIGVDFNPDMLQLAQKHRKTVAKAVGWSNVEFRKGKIQDLRTNLSHLDTLLESRTVGSADDYMALTGELQQYSKDNPLISDDSIDVIVSNCVLNLVQQQDKKQLFNEMYRVLKKGGRVAISDIVSDETVPQHLQDDAHLWSGCISGAFQELDFLKAFEAAGFYGVEISKRDEKPWKVVEGIEFRSVTVTAWKGKEGPCVERNQAVIYKGPWKQVCDDDNHVFQRGVRSAVCDKTFRLLQKEPYKNEFVAIEPYHTIPLESAGPFICKTGATRHPKITKGEDYDVTTENEGCSGESCC